MAGCDRPIKAVPSSSPDYRTAQTLLGEYQQALNRVQQQSNAGFQPLPAVPQADDGAIPLMPGMLPSTLQQGAIARLRTLQQQQQAFFTAQKRFATTVAELDKTFPTMAEGYAYSVRSTPQTAIATATAQKPDLVSYTAIIFLTLDGASLSAPNRAIPLLTVEGMCQTVAAAQMAPAVPKLVNNQVQCGPGAIAVDNATAIP